jgi:hypothetical protein
MSDSIIQPLRWQEAWEQGLQHGLTQVALNMLQEDIDLAQIAKLTGLSLESITNLEANRLDSDRGLVKDFLLVSESPLNKIWLDSEENGAWKDL